MGEGCADTGPALLPPTHDQAESRHFLQVGGCSERKLHQCRRSLWDVGALEGLWGAVGPILRKAAALMASIPAPLHSAVQQSPQAPWTVTTLVVL